MFVTNNGSEISIDDGESCSGKSSGSGGDTSTEDKLTSINGGASSSNGEERIQENISKKETTQVDRLRYVLLTVLIASAIAISVAVFFIMSHAQQNEYQTQYDGTSAKIISSFESVISKIGSVYSVGLAATIEGYDRSSNTNGTATNHWPFVTLPSFAQRAASARELSEALLVSIQPIVSDVDRNLWETYSVTAGRHWITDGLNYQNDMGIDIFDINPTPLEELLMTNDTKTPIFYIDTNGNEISSGRKETYLPSWQAMLIRSASPKRLPSDSRQTTNGPVSPSAATSEVRPRKADVTAMSRRKANATADHGRTFGHGGKTQQSTPKL